MQWVKDKINLSEMMIAVGTFGGPIGMSSRSPCLHCLALTRDTRNKGIRVRSQLDSKPLIYIYTSSGKLISTFEVWISFLFEIIL
jgi:hypothetical protein